MLTAVVAGQTHAGMVTIPEGWYIRGDAEDGESDARTNAIYVSTFEIDSDLVTLTEWQTVYTWATANGYAFANVGAGFAFNHPVQTVSWYDAVKWCNARSELEGLTPCYYTDTSFTTVYRSGNVSLTAANVNWNANGYRLPTETEWEKAARGGRVAQRFPLGMSISHSQACYQTASVNSLAYDNGPVGVAPSSTVPIKQYQANDYGLYDMTGDVSEWCWDWYSSTAYSATATNNPQGPSTGSFRINRGGNWVAFASLARCGDRNSASPTIAKNIYGFRVAQGAGAGGGGGSTPVQQSVDFESAMNPTNLIAGTNFALQATSSPIGTAVTFAITSQNPSGIALIGFGGFLQAIGTGTFTVTATAASTSQNGTQYLAGSSSLTFFVIPPPSGTTTNSQSIQFDSTLNTTNPVYGSTIPLTAIASPLGSNVSFAITHSTPGNIASIDGSGNLTVLGAGNFTVTASIGTIVIDDTNFYTAASTNLNFTATKALLTVTANNTNRNVGTTNPVFTVSYSGFIGSDSPSVLTGKPTVTSTATTTSAAGTYPINIAQGTLAAVNYSFSLASGTLTVTPVKAQTIQFSSSQNATNLPYGTNITLAVGSSPLGADVALAITKSSPTNIASLVGRSLTVNGVGTFTITASVGALSEGGTNYLAAVTNLNFTAAKVPLKVIADNYSRLKGATNPVFTFAYSGFVNGETSNVLAGKPSLTTTATTLSVVGSYPITIALGTLASTHYAFSFVNGTLTVYTNPPIVTLSSLTKFLGTNQLTVDMLRYILTNNYAHPAVVDSETLSDFLGSSNITTVTQADVDLFLSYSNSAPSGNISASVLARIVGDSSSSVDQAGLNTVLGHYWAGNPPYINQTFGGGSPNFSFTVSNFTFQVQYSTDLVNWQEVGQAVFGFTDTNATSHPNAYYRIVTPTSGQ